MICLRVIEIGFKTAEEKKHLDLLSKFPLVFPARMCAASVKTIQLDYVLTTYNNAVTTLKQLKFPFKF